MKFKLSCPICGKKCIDQSELNIHMTQLHDKSIEQQIPGSLESQVKSQATVVNSLNVDLNHHIFISGQSGSGKSVLGKYIFANIPPTDRAIFYDYKNDPSHDSFCSHFPTFDDFTQLKRYYETDKKGFFNRKSKDMRTVFRPVRVKSDTIKTHSMENKNWVKMDDLCDYAYTQGNFILLLDEINPFTTPQTIVPSLFDVMTLGRSRGITIISTSQRPNTIHNSLISEAQTRYLFRQEIESDRTKIKGICGAEVADQLNGLDNQMFVVSRIGGSWNRGHINISKKLQWIL